MIAKVRRPQKYLRGAIDPREAGVRRCMRIAVRGLSVFVLVLASFPGAGFSGRSRLHAQEIATTDRFASQVRPYLDRFCVECHMQGNAAGGIALDQFRTSTEAVGAGRTWLRVLDAIEGGIMPPVDAEQPGRDATGTVIDWINEDFLAAQCRQRKSPAAVVIRRLNRQEYRNTVCDLTGVNIDHSADFPPDDVGFGYDNVGSALNVSPVHIEKYFAAAERAMQAAIVLPDVEPCPPTELIGLQTYPLRDNEPVEFEHHMKPGRYLADFSLVRVGVAESTPPPRLVIGFGHDSRTVDAIRVQDETVVYRYWLTVAEGDNTVSVALASGQSESATVEMPEDATANVSGDKRYGNDRGLHVDSMVVRGPVPVAPAGLPSSHTALLFRTPGSGDALRLECGREVIGRFAERAFRRPVTDEEVDRLVGIFRIADDRGESFERAVQVALTAVLMSPQFLFLVEPEDTQDDRPLTDYELASRLSYFLWSTMPDEQLLAEAQQGTLRGNLHECVARMLADHRSQAFVENFTGQWLQLRDLKSVAPDLNQFPGFSIELRNAMQQETELFFAHILRNNLSVLELLDADYTFVNDLLARHYDQPGVEGSEFRRIDLAGSQRGGIITQAGILTLTSNHNRTSPVKRGQWILQQLLGTPPPPPPPGVIPLDESETAAESASLRDRLQTHRANPECASCHNQMDPIGFALENFDAVGRWRTADGQFAIDASGELPGGRRFENAADLRRVLKTTETRKFTRCLIENLLTYALGRGLEAHDYCTVEAIRERLVQDEYRIQTIVLGIVESDAFGMRGVTD